MYDAEAIIARALEGKFFNINGVDVIAQKRDQADCRDMVRQVEAARKARREDEARKSALAKLNRQMTVMPMITPQAVIAAVAFAHSVNIEDIVGNSRSRGIMKVRQHAYFLVRELIGLPFPRIGRHFKRDHSTVMHGCEAFKTHHLPKFQREDEVARRMLNLSHSATPADSGVSAEPRLT